MQVNDKVRFKTGPFTEILGEDATYTVTAAYEKGDETDYGETYNGSVTLYRIEADDASCPKPFRVLYETEGSIKPAGDE